MGYPKGLWFIEKKVDRTENDPVPRINLWDAKHNGTVTFMFDSRNTWNVNCNAESITKFCACRWNRSPTTEVILRAEQAHFLENYNIFRAQAIIPKFTTVVPLPATKSESATWMQLYQILRLARKPAVVLLLYFFLTLLVFDPTSLLLYYSFALLLFCSAIFLTPKSLFFTTRFSYVGNFSTKFPLITGLIILSVKYENPNEPTSKGIQQVWRNIAHVFQCISSKHREIYVIIPK